MFIYSNGSSSIKLARAMLRLHVNSTLSNTAVYMCLFFLSAVKVRVAQLAVAGCTYQIS
jgi:hypothetical protein